MVNVQLWQMIVVVWGLWLIGMVYLFWFYGGPRRRKLRRSRMEEMSSEQFDDLYRALEGKDPPWLTQRERPDDRAEANA